MKESSWPREWQRFDVGGSLTEKDLGKAYFRKAGHAFVIDKKGHPLVNLGRFEHETSKQHAKLKFLERENVQKKKGIACKHRT